MNSSARVAPFCKLADPQRYLACPWDLTADPGGRAHWIEFFKRHLGTILAVGIEAATTRGESLANAQARAARCRQEFVTAFDAFDANPRGFGRVTILTLDRWRDDLLRRHGFVDPFIDLKNRENEKMLRLLPELCAQLDALTGPQQLQAIIRGLFAGNIFDMGADATAQKFLGQSPDFFATRDSVAPRPWLIDDYDALEARLLGGPVHRNAVFFVDNAGSDFVLGALPMIRWLAGRGTRIVLAANSRPTLNDITIDDVQTWWPRILQAEPSLRPLAIDLVGTGTGEPLIDLSRINPQLNVLSADADLVILEGMGRGVESNLEAAFSCDALNIAMVKDTAVAARHGGKLFDLVCQFRPAAPSGPIPH